jgi:hypothetical protein
MNYSSRQCLMRQGYSFKFFYHATVAKSHFNCTFLSWTSITKWLIWLGQV